MNHFYGWPRYEEKEKGGKLPAGKPIQLLVFPRPITSSRGGKGEEATTGRNVPVEKESGHPLRCSSSIFFHPFVLSLLWTWLEGVDRTIVLEG